METVKIKSPIDGSIYAERPVAGDQAVGAAVERARAAQVEWAGTPIAERGGHVLAFLDALVAMNDEIVPSLPGRWAGRSAIGGEKGGVEERIRYMVEIAERALAPVVANDRPGFRRYVKREPLGVVLRHRAVELSVPDRRQHRSCRR